MGLCNDISDSKITYQGLVGPERREVQKDTETSTLTGTENTDGGCLQVTLTVP